MRTLILCTWFDGGPDTEEFAYKVLDENFNVINTSIKESYNVVIDLYREESRDRVSYVRWHFNGNIVPKELATPEMLADSKTLDNLWNTWYSYTEELESKLGEDWQDEYSDNYHPEEANKAHNLWKVARQKEDELINKYSKMETSYIVHYIGVEEFCRLEHIDKVVRLN